MLGFFFLLASCERLGLRCNPDVITSTSDIPEIFDLCQIQSKVTSS